MARNRINTEKLIEVLNERGCTADHTFDSKTLADTRKSNVIKKQNVQAEYEALIASQEVDERIEERARRLADYRKRLGVDDESTTIDDLLEIASKKSQLTTNLTNKENRTMSTTILTEMISNASSKAAFSEVVEQETTYRRRMPQPQNDVRFLNLREMQIKETLNHSSAPSLAPAGSPGVVSKIAPLTIAENSTVIKAGANLMLVSQDAKPLNDKDRAGYFYESETVFILSEKAQFQPVREGQPALESDLPVHREILNREAVKTYMFSTNVSRRRAERFFSGELDEALLRSIVLGLAGAADKALLERIKISGYSEPHVVNSSLPPETFSLSKVSSLGMRFGDLYAIIGSAATGASINAIGQLTANGIKAEFSDAITETIIGNFKKSAVTIGQEIQLIANRSGENALDGSMTVTCLCDIGTLIPIGGLALPFFLGV